MGIKASKVWTPETESTQKQKKLNKTVLKKAGELYTSSLSNEAKVTAYFQSMGEAEVESVPEQFTNLMTAQKNHDSEDEMVVGPGLPKVVLLNKTLDEAKNAPDVPQIIVTPPSEDGSDSCELDPTDYYVSTPKGPTPDLLTPPSSSPSRTAGVFYEATPTKDEPECKLKFTPDSKEKGDDECISR